MIDRIKLLAPFAVVAGTTACGSGPARDPAPAAPTAAPVTLSAALRSYLAPSLLAALDDPETGTGCAAARTAYVHGSAEALEGNTYLDTYPPAADPRARACERYRAAAEADLDCCKRGFVAGVSALVQLREQWIATEFEPMDGGHTRDQAASVENCIIDYGRGREFALERCDPRKASGPRCPAFEPATQLEGGHLGCWSAGFEQLFALCSQGPSYRDMKARGVDCPRDIVPRSK